MQQIRTVNKGTGPLGTDSSPKAKSFYTAVRDFDSVTRAVIASSPRQILAQGKEIMRKLDAIIDACAANSAGDKAGYFNNVKIRAQNAKTRAIGPLLRAIENPGQFHDPRPRLLTVIGTFDIQTMSREPVEAGVQWMLDADANHRVACYRLDQLLNANLIGQALFTTSVSEKNLDVIGLIQKADSEWNDSFDVLMSGDGSELSRMARQMRRENQRQLLDILLMSGKDIATLPAYADAAFSLNILALDGEMLTLVMDDLLDSQALGVLSQQLIEVHAHLLHLELEGRMYTPAHWKAAAQLTL